MRDYAGGVEAEAVDAAQRRLGDAARLSLEASDLDGLRGQEGEAAHAYWSVFAHLIRNDDPVFTFLGRNRRPPRDAVNAVLSFLYALASLDARAACESHGLDPQMGFLHRDRPGRMSLALDLMEQVRAPLVTASASVWSTAVNSPMRDFQRQKTGAVMLSDEGRKTVLTVSQERKRPNCAMHGSTSVCRLGWF